MHKRLATILALAVLGSGCSGGFSATPRPVTAAEATALLSSVATLSATRTAEAASKACADLSNGCHGLSSSWSGAPDTAPTTAPAVLCQVPLPSVGGARLLVVTGRDAQGRAYVGQVLVERVDGKVRTDEPAYWLGITYTSLRKGRAWSGASDDPANRRRQAADAHRACDDPEQWKRAVGAPDRVL